MRSSQFYGLIVKIKNKITLHFTRKKTHIYIPSKFSIPVPLFLFQNIVNILLYYSCFIKKTTLKGFLHYVQVYLLLDLTLMNPEAKPGGAKTF